MSDRRYREAQREWEVVRSLPSWVTYLRESRRVGLPIFSANDVAASTEGEVVDYIPTLDGFIAKVKNANHPSIEITFMVPMGLDLEPEGFPLWGTWSGKVIVEWGDVFYPQCPGISIEVESTDRDPGGRELEDYYYYEGDCVTDSAQLLTALNDPLHWNY